MDCRTTVDGSARPARLPRTVSAKTGPLALRPNLAIGRRHPGSTGATVTFTTLSQAQGETDPESLNGDTLQANLIMPEPTHFLRPMFAPVAIIRPTSTQNSGAVAAVQAFVQDGLFLGQTPLNNPELVQVLMGLAELADAARRNG